MKKNIYYARSKVLKSTKFRKIFFQYYSTILFSEIMVCAIFLLVLSTSIDSKNMEGFGQPNNAETYGASTARIRESIYLQKI
jgi:hypothetical protein